MVCSSIGTLHNGGIFQTEGSLDWVLGFLKRFIVGGAGDSWTLLTIFNSSGEFGMT